MIHFKSLAVLLIVVNILLSAFWLIWGDIHYDVDVARDLLVMDDIVRNGNLTLLGPRSGAIDGIFHGPLWFYINLPIFIIGKGNPITIGWFWFILSVVFLYITFWITKKLFDERVALFSTMLLSANSIVNPSIGLRNFYNPYGAVFITPIFFFLLYKYISTMQYKYLIFCFLSLGFIIQFQMAFGVPVLITMLWYLFYFLIKNKKTHHFFSLLILLIPLSSFILFDIKHDWLQLKALVNYLGKTDNFYSNIPHLLKLRVNELLFNFFDQILPGKNIFTFTFSLVFLTFFIYVYKKSKTHTKIIYFLFGLLFSGFWLISLLYQGSLGNYFWPFLPLGIMIFSSFINLVNKKVFLLIFAIVYLINIITGIQAIEDFENVIQKRGPHSWAFNLYVAKNIYQDARNDFGYFTFSPDRFAYQQRYAMIYAKNFYPQMNSYSSIKKPLTYLIEVDPPKDRQDISPLDWRISDIKINRDPDKIFRWDFIKVEKYNLTSEEIGVSPNPYVLDNNFLR